MKENTFFDVCIPTVNLIFFPFKSLNTDYNSVFNKNRTNESIKVAWLILRFQIVVTKQETAIPFIIPSSYKQTSAHTESFSIQNL